MTTTELEAKCAELERERDILMSAPDETRKASVWLAQQVEALRASLTAAEQRCAGLEEALREALGFIQDVGVGEDDDIETMAMIERLSGRLTATLAYTDTPAVGVRVLLLGMTYDQFKDVMAQCRHEAVDNGSGDPPAGYEQLEPDSAALRIADNCWHGGMDAMETAVLNWFFDQQQALRTPSGEKGEAT